MSYERTLGVMGLWQLPLLPPLLLLQLLFLCPGAAGERSAAIAAAAGVATKPEFLEAVPNITVAVGRDAVLPCVVKNLHDYKVAFIHLDRQMILTIHHQVITRISRFSVNHDKHHTWSLHINNIQKEDKGYYMCQINTDPMLKQIGYVNVVVPPNIVDDESSPSSVSVLESHNASLVCQAEGTPEPKIKWMREDKKPIILKRKKKEGKKEKLEVHGKVLDLIRISRTEMGAYLCIAQNGVPPSISKRIILTVEFSPLIWIPEQLVGSPLGANVTLKCHIESSPEAMSYWAFKDQMVFNSTRFDVSHSYHSEYKIDVVLTIRDLREEDLGNYRCISKNSHGESDGTIMLYLLETSTTEKAATAAYEEDNIIFGANEYEESSRSEDDIVSGVAVAGDEGQSGFTTQEVSNSDEDKIFMKEGKRRRKNKGKMSSNYRYQGSQKSSCSKPVMHGPIISFLLLFLLSVKKQL